MAKETQLMKITNEMAPNVTRVIGAISANFLTNFVEDNFAITRSRPGLAAGTVFTGSAIALTFMPKAKEGRKGRGANTARYALEGVMVMTGAELAGNLLDRFMGRVGSQTTITDDTVNKSKSDFRRFNKA